MSKFISITNNISEIEGRNRFNLIAVYATLKQYIADESLKVKRYTTALSKETGLSEKTISRLIPLLKEEGLVLDITKSETDANGKILEHKCNLYKFKDDMRGNYTMVSPEFVKAPISATLKGFILVMRSLCKNGSNSFTFGDTTNLMKAVQIKDKRTYDSYMKELEGTDYFKIIGGTIVFNRRYFFLFNPNKVQTTENVLFTMIWDYSYQSNVVPPVKHLNGKSEDRCLELMALQLKGTVVNLPEKCPNLPECVTLEYFMKALCNDSHEIKKKESFVFVL